MSPELTKILSFVSYNPKFEADMLEAILSSISKKFGADVTSVVLYDFSDRKPLDKEDVVRKPEDFENSLQTLFGPSSPLIINLVIKEIEIRFQLADKGSVHISEAIRKAWKARE